jgi:hypothetical protein
MTSVLAGGECPAALLPGKEPPVHWIGGWVSPRVGLDDVKKKPLPNRDSNSDPSVVQPVASCYTDCAIPAHILKMLSRIRGLRD